MEHLVGITIKDATFGTVGFMTWGRILHPVDSESLLALVEKHAHKCGIDTIVSSNLCDSLQEIAMFPYFYEGLFEFSQTIIPDGSAYQTWQTTMRKALEEGNEIYFLGLTPEQKKLHTKKRRHH